MRAFRMLVAASLLALGCGCAEMPRVWCADPSVQATVPIIECLAPEA